ncbi:SPOR domain-containing protein [Robertkochia aurantiaca]|uniref:HU domain-containing protein n=1 Tax=Robertkochia aurantiaca TaxID=2873700 RepID=UPI001CCBE467|nr:SPOR domain-containing protein [Robertkochia sp. 3YJGBD-33]
MRIEKYIGDLLYRYQCVTIPEFGSFLTRYQPARIHETTDAFYPPSKELSFNSQLTSDDGLLTKYVAEVCEKTYEEASAEIKKTVASWKESLEKEETVKLDKIGELALNDSKRIVFQPSYQTNFLTSSFGLSTFVSPGITREELKKEVQKLEEKAPISITPEARSSRSYLKYAAIALLAISAGTLGYRFTEQNMAERMELARQEAQEELEKNIQQATFFDDSPLELPAVTLKLSKKERKYHIVAGAYRVEANADKRVSQLLNKGYDAHKVGVNKFGLHQVAFASFAEVNEALAYLRKIKKEESKEAWLLVDKKQD